MLVKYLRFSAPVLGIVAMAAMFLKMPATPPIFGCKFCASGTSYLPLFGAAYFAALTAIPLLFPGFPGRQMAKGGLVFAATLAFAMIYLDFPKICALCLTAHGCHILMWTIWAACPAKDVERGPYGKKISLLMLAPLSAAALFIGVNHLVMKPERDVLQIGESLPSFSTQTISGRAISNADSKSVKIVLNFISPDCPYCQEQQEKLKELLPALDTSSRFVNVTPKIPDNLSEYPPNIEWVEDPDEKLLELFHVSGYPTLFVGKDGKIIQVVLGVPDHLKAHLSIIF